MSQRRPSAAVASLATLLVAAGCQLTPKLFDGYADTIDTINEHPLRAEKLYVPKLDLTRIGRPDGKDLKAEY